MMEEILHAIAPNRLQLNVFTDPQLNYRLSGNRNTIIQLNEFTDCIGLVLRSNSTSIYQRAQQTDPRSNGAAPYQHKNATDDKYVGRAVHRNSSNQCGWWKLEFAHILEKEVPGLTRRRTVAGRWGWGRKINWGINLGRVGVYSRG